VDPVVVAEDGKVQWLDLPMQSFIDFVRLSAFMIADTQNHRLDICLFG
jgi:hypothetical protein